jgi:hypothetical protein
VLLGSAMLLVMASGAGAKSNAGPQASNIPYAMVVRVLDPIKGEYQIEVENTNPSKSIYSFTWRPPGGLTVSKITGNSGGSCHLPGDGSITCTGKIPPPASQTGVSPEDMTVNFTANGLTRTWMGSYYTYYGVVGAISVQQGSNDLPTCKKGTSSTPTHLCASA